MTPDEIRELGLWMKVNVSISVPAVTRVAT
jgi:hypothetical protein